MVAVVIMELVIMEVVTVVVEVMGIVKVVLMLVDATYSYEW